jgi:hypothetical protein
MVSKPRPMVVAKGHKRTVALDQSALLEALDALKVAQSIYQALIEAELTAVITGTAPDPAPSTR